MQKLLVTGASGFLGWNLCQLAATHWEVYGTCFSKTIAIPGTTIIAIDLTDLAALKDLFQTVQPDAVIHLAAQSSPNRCQNQPEASYRLNVTTSVHLAALCADRERPYVFASSEMVFDGLKAPYQESDRVSPINRYGEQKALAEVAVLDRYPKAAVCRMPLMFGAVPPTASSFIQPFIHALRTGQELKLFTDEFRTPVSGSTAAKGLLLALQTFQGRFHLGGKERVSRYEFGCRMAGVLALPTATIKACRQQDVPMAAKRPPDLSLDSSQAFALGYAPLSLREALTALRGLV
ncbi:SDR family oxidoreductase [Stenomitos frigidus]|uniref:NAD(P)-dependent oxidoreductase n=1 Tax=Stenomitos frigidus ULC18 TaxID=2107698 RepID=A0A2T1DSN4_9CYAN|nr:NAD(P)-dependent oxidoreductase [Stenomitos frigidus]PSB23526.1 NAD(P)-dependent oxidoreductase [Stenomitos frigidus ULC18]